MKHLTVCCVSIMCVLTQTFAQSDRFNKLIGISPYFSTKFSPESFRYPVQVQNKLNLNNPNWHQEPLDVQSYFEIQMPFQLLKRMKDQFYCSYSMAANFQFYKSQLNHTFSGRPGYETEKITTKHLNAGIGMARIFFLDDTKRLFVIPEVTGYVDIYDFTSYQTSDFDITDDTYPVREDFYSRIDVSGGYKLSLWVNCRITRQIGIGFVFPKIADACFYSRSVPGVPDEFTKGFELTVDPLKIPRFFLFWHIGKSATFE
jgi:hypothetical protein